MLPQDTIASLAKFVEGETPVKLSREALGERARKQRDGLRHRLEMRSGS